MKPTVYIETTIPSYYHDDRAEIMHDVLRTRQWWDEERDQYECFGSLVVIDELSAGSYAKQDRCLRLARPLPILDVTDDVIRIAKVYQAERLMPVHPAADALHVALASWYRMDYLLTWNCRHIANANKARHLEAINVRMHLGLPMLVTPHQLQSWEETP